MVKNLPSNARDGGSIPGRGIKIPHAAGQLSLCIATTEPVCSGAHEPQLLKPSRLEPMLRHKRSHRNEKPAHHNEE